MEEIITDFVTGSFAGFNGIDKKGNRYTVCLHVVWFIADITASSSVIDVLGHIRDLRGPIALSDVAHLQINLILYLILPQHLRILDVVM